MTMGMPDPNKKRLKSKRYGLPSNYSKDPYQKEHIPNKPPAPKPKAMDTSTSTIPGQPPGQTPGTFNMAAVNAPEAGVPEAGIKPGFDGLKFAKIAGMVGAAIAPRGKYGSWQKDLGLAAAGLAGEEIKKREGAPDLALDRDLKRARIEHLKRERPEKPRYVTDMKQNEDTGIWERGRFDVGTGDFTAYRDATDAEIESKVSGKPLDPDDIDIHGSFEYPGSSGQRTLRGVHQETAAGSQAGLKGRVLLKDAQAGYGSGLEAAITGARGDVPPDAPNEAPDISEDIQPEPPDETGIDYTPESLKASKPPESSKTKTGGIPNKPPDNALQPEAQRDFKDRQSYSDSVIKEMGYDPFTLSVDDLIEKAQEEELPELFKKAFDGEILYRDIDTLDPDEKKHWTAVLRAFNVNAEKGAKEEIASGKEIYKRNMKGFEDRVADKKAIPGAIDKSLKNMFTSLDGSGKSVVEVPPTVRSQAIMEAVELVNSGKFSGVEAVPFVIQKLAREKAQIADIKDALDSLPEWKAGWFTSDAQDIEKHKQTIADAVEMVGDEKEVKKALKEKGWTDKNIALVMPKKTEAAEVSPEMGSKQKYNTVFDVAEALKRGEISRPEAKRLAMGIKGSKKIATDYMKAK